jgi:hypothetical protein
MSFLLVWPCTIPILVRQIWESNRYLIARLPLVPPQSDTSGERQRSLLNPESLQYVQL